MINNIVMLRYMCLMTLDGINQIMKGFSYLDVGRLNILYITMRNGICTVQYNVTTANKGLYVPTSA